MKRKPKTKTKPATPQELGGAARAEALTHRERFEVAQSGGIARAKKLSAAQRKAIAKAAVRARERKRKLKKLKGQ